MCCSALDSCSVPFCCQWCSYNTTENWLSQLKEKHHTGSWEQMWKRGGRASFTWADTPKLHYWFITVFLTSYLRNFDLINKQLRIPRAGFCPLDHSLVSFQMTAVHLTHLCSAQSLLPKWGESCGVIFHEQRQLRIVPSVYETISVRF